IGLPPSGLDNAIVVLRSVAGAPVSLAVDSAGNGVFETGETVLLAPTWRNATAPAMSMTGALTGFSGPAGPAYTIVDGAADYGTIAPGDAASCGADCYSLSIAAASRPIRHWDATVTETVSPTAATKTWVLHIGGSFDDVPPASVFYRFVE